MLEASHWQKFGGMVTTAFVDFRKAFHCVSQKTIFFKKLKHRFGIEGHLTFFYWKSTLLTILIIGKQYLQYTTTTIHSLHYLQHFALNIEFKVFILRNIFILITICTAFLHYFNYNTCTTNSTILTLLTNKATIISYLGWQTIWIVDHRLQ